MRCRCCGDRDASTATVLARTLALGPALAVALSTASLAACGRPTVPTHAPEPAPAVQLLPDANLMRPAISFLDSAVAAGAAPGAVIGVSVRGDHFYYGTGWIGLDNPARPDSATVYDLASLTKVIGLTTAMMLAVDERRIDLDAPIQRYVPEFRGTWKELVTVRHLLTHSSGLRAGRPLYRETANRADALMLADTTPLDTVPGVRSVYSDLGAIVLTQAVERVFGMRIDSVLALRVFDPLDMRSTRYLPPPEWLDHIAPTELDAWRGRMIHGEVHDENAARLGGVSGHAGLFSDAADLLVFADWLLAGAGAPGAPPLRPGSPASPLSVRTFIARQHLPEGTSRVLGWDTPSGVSTAGHLMAPVSFGHTGFTGTSIWMDPTRAVAVVVLTNRVHPTRANQKLDGVRGGVADRVMQALFPVAAP